MKKYTLVIVAAILFRIVLSFLIWHPDVANHMDWGIRFWQYGPAKFYSANVWNFTWPNQPPGTIYIFAGVRKLYEGIFWFLSYLHFQIHVFPGSILLYLEKNLYMAMLKLPAILSDLGIGILIYKIIEDLGKSKKTAGLGMVVWLLNPAIWFNSAVWGQYDSVINFIALLSFYLLSRKKFVLSLIMIILSVYIKASLAIFLPIYTVLALRQKYTFKKYVLGILTAFILFLGITLPFSHGNPITWIFYLYKDKIFADQLHVVTANAFNLWGAVFGVKDSAVEVSDSVTFLSIPYRNWSYIIFAIFYIPSLLVVFRKQDLKSIVWSLAIAAFSSFMFLTNMHERYIFPLFPYFTILTFLEITLIFNYMAVSLINVFNLYNLWFTPKIPSAVEILSGSNMLLPRIFSIVSVFLFLFFYLRFIKFNLTDTVLLSKFSNKD